MSVLFRPFRTEFTILPVPVPRERRSDAEAFPDQPGAPGAFGGEFRIFRLRNQPEQRVGGGEPQAQETVRPVEPQSVEIRTLHFLAEFKA